MGIFNYALESDDDVVVADGLPSEMEEASDIIDDTSNEVDAVGGDIDDALDGAETLGNISDTIEKNPEDMNETAAQVAEIAIESIARRLGMRNPTRIMPSMESFGSTSSRLTASRIAVESIGTWLSGIWKAIKDAFSSMWKAVADMMEKVFGETGKLERLIKDAETRVGAFTAPAKPLGAIENEYLARAFRDYTKKTEIMKSSADFVEAGAAFGNAVKEGLNGLTSVMDEVAKFVKDDKTEDAAAKKTLFASMSQKLSGEAAKAIEKASGKPMTAAALNSVGKTTISPTAKVTAYGPFVNGYMIYVYDDPDSPVDSIRTTEGKDESFDKIKAPFAIKVLNEAEMKATIEDAKRILKALQSYRAVRGDVKKFESNYNSAFDKVISKTKSLDSENPDFEKGMKAIMTPLRQSVSRLGRADASVAKSCVKIGYLGAKASLKYVTWSLQQYEKNKEKS